MTTIDHDAVRQLAELLDDTGLTEIEYQTDEVRIRVAKSAPAVSYMAAPVGAAAPAAASADAAGEADPASHPGAIKAPMVGVVYVAPEPGAPPFVQVGDSISKGQTLFLIEAMKTFNPVRAEVGGRITRILVGDGQAVEYGEPLVIVE
ncbi:acetyl-CoA carboxylase biotin carboxyl carrier protein [Roseospirillum parvum]|uniref:Biotin carboxyl carrier protein of acetyl-CoA carboxylase n=1 Tax=Roseospirillum parvum TaxID=83401 RepID=A0A1G7ULN5_9PROT|nr:acetyl-CoA carboxylase biotin carboxyl carrier protein [Roseospirillum parvum]SDG48141.1 acetyl-CoA carboxylase biotin carboxyl carrier protein [Roseospirillum parvum]